MEKLSISEVTSQKPHGGGKHTPSAFRVTLILQCTTTIILGANAYYLYSLIKIVEASISDLLPEVSHDPPKSEVNDKSSCSAS